MEKFIEIKGYQELPKPNDWGRLEIACVKPISSIKRVFCDLTGNKIYEVEFNDGELMIEINFTEYQRIRDALTKHTVTR